MFSQWSKWLDLNLDGGRVVDAREALVLQSEVLVRNRTGSEGGTYNPEVRDVERASVVRVRVCGDEDGDGAGGGEAGGHGGDSNKDGGKLHFGWVGGLLVE